MLEQGRRKMKKVRGALRALKAQVLLGGPGHALQNFFVFLHAQTCFSALLRFVLQSLSKVLGHIKISTKIL